MPPKLLYVGSPLLDITCVCTSEYLKKYHLKPDDCVRSSQDELHTQLFAEVYANPNSTFTAGGSAQNSARISKWVLREDSSAHVWFAGCVGKDAYAQTLENILKEDGVIPCYARNESLSTGMCVCLVLNDGESRSMCTDLGSAATYNIHHLKEPITRKAMEEADVIFVVGFFFSHSPDVVKYLAEYCHSNNKLFAISLSASYVCSFHFQDLLKCLPLIDIVFGNLEEARTFLKKIDSEVDHANAKTCAKKIADFAKENGRPRIVVISNGAEPVTVCRTNEQSVVYEVPEVCNVVDTIGCGDALAGGFLATYSTATGCIKTAIRAGIKCATKIAKVRGCTLPN